MKRHVYLSYRIIFLVATGVNIIYESLVLLIAAVLLQDLVSVPFASCLADKKCSSTPGWSDRIGW